MLQSARRISNLDWWNAVMVGSRRRSRHPKKSETLRSNMRRFSILSLLLFVAVPLFATTYTVNDLSDVPDATPGDNICDAGSGVCTLRAAIMEANAHAGADAIAFGVAGTITPSAILPSLVDEVDIDATTAPGYTTAPVVNLDGSGGIAYGFHFFTGSANSTLAGTQIYGFAQGGVRVEADGITITRSYIGPVTAGSANGVGVEILGAGATIGGADGDGNVISGNQGSGIVAGGSGHSIRDNFIGADATGMSILGNGLHGIEVNADNVTIGSTVAAERNVISGNSDIGVNIESGTGNTVAGNFIGVDVAGTGAIGNLGVGVRVASSGNTVGTTAARNVVSGNGAQGILVPGGVSNVIVRNNYVGTDVTGASGIGNFEEGIRVTSSSNIDVGGLAAGEGNLVSFNGGDGISIAEVIDVRVHGNIVGLNAAGDSILGNGGAGIGVSAGDGVLVGAIGTGRNVVSGNSFGGIFTGSGVNNIIEGNYVGTDITGMTDLGNLDVGIGIGFSDGDIVRSNVVSGNDSHGIEVTIFSSNVVIHSNLVGVAADGTTPLGNAGDGVNVCDSASDTTVGSIALGGNTIANNAGNGIGVEPTALLGNNWAANSIYDNDQLGIDLELDGVTPNDLGDPDAGPNNLQNFPVITDSATTATASQTRGTINSTPNTNLTIYVFSSPGPDPLGNGEGQTYLGTTNVMTDGSGDATWVVNGSASTAGHVASATADGPDGSSEFSNALPVSLAPTVQFSAADYPTAESGTVLVTVTRTGELDVSSTVQYTTSNGTAGAADYGTSAGTLTFAPGDASETFSVTITADTLDEPAESINLTLSNPVMATLGAQSTATITIADDDPPPAITIDDVSQPELNGGTSTFTFTVSLSAPSANTITVDYATANGAATAPSDYTAIGTTQLTFAPLSTSQTINVTVNGDLIVEPNETFFVNLSNPGNATLAETQGVGTIENDEGTPAIIISDVSQAEGNAGTTNFAFTVTLSAPSATPVTVDYATADDTATAPSDYAAIGSTQLLFPALSTSQQITVAVAGDTVTEPNEAFLVNLSNPSGAAITDAQGLGTIQNDEGIPAINISNVSLAEGDGGTTNFVFDVTLSAPSATPVTVDYATADGTGTAPSDYTAIATRTLTFPALSTSQQITVAVAGELLVEPDETFFVNLSNPAGATLADPQGLGMITNDDLNADLSVAKTSSSPTFTSGQQITFTITVTNAGPGPATAVTVTDVLPAGTTFVSASSGCTGTTTVSCNLATIASGSNTSVSIVVTATGESNITNTATAASANTDPASGNNTGSVTITAAAAAEESIPTLSTWLLMALGAALAALALRRV
jgi:uncharacterized repeat protein (TIGR01451 family)